MVVVRSCNSNRYKPYQSPTPGTGGQPGAGLEGPEGVTTVTWGSKFPRLGTLKSGMPSFTILIQSLHSTMCSAESALRLNPRPASRSCRVLPGSSGAARPGPAAPHINLSGPPVKLMLTRSYTDLLQPDPLLSQLVKAAPQSCLAQGKLLDR